MKLSLSHPAGAWLRLAMNFPGWGWLQRIRGKLLQRICGGWVTGLSETKAKPSSWGLAELGNQLSRVGVVAEDTWYVVAEDMWWVGG